MKEERRSTLPVSFHAKDEATLRSEPFTHSYCYADTVELHDLIYLQLERSLPAFESLLKIYNLFELLYSYVYSPTISFKNSF